MNLSVEAVPLSGGHTHYDNRPAGSLGRNTIVFASSQTGPESTTYTSSEVSGTEKITAVAVGGNSKEVSIDVKVPKLISLGISGQGCWRLAGDTLLHFDNHWGTSSTVGKVSVMACDYRKKTGIAIGINDMSLIWGGVFDICGTWNSADKCSNAPDGGHSSHRRGKSVDVDHSGVKEDVLDKIAKRHSCKRKEVTKIHYQCP
ncbi:MAG: hypothetical protein WA162_01840 [Thermodesulfobacteriota bacterium]